jgi:hypothetical protein
VSRFVGSIDDYHAVPPDAWRRTGAGLELTLTLGQHLYRLVVAGDGTSWAWRVTSISRPDAQRHGTAASEMLAQVAAVAAAVHLDDELRAKP